MKLDQPADRRRPVVLVVDDDEPNRRTLCHLLSIHGYDTTEAEDGKAAMESVSQRLPDLILLDLQMPRMGGLEVLGALKGAERTRRIPAIILTGETDHESRLAALRSGADDFVTKPMDPAELSLRVGNHLRLKEYGDLLHEHGRRLEQEVASRTEQLRESYRETTLLLVSAAEFRDTDTGGHIRRVSRFAEELSRQMQMGEEFLDWILVASPMHDIGKIAIPDRILLKSGPLDAQEWEVMKSHTLLGAQILRSGTTSYVRMGAEIAVSHHERWDGTGYPRGLSGDAIPMPGRIMSICDVYDALRSRRPYKEPRGHDETVSIITEGDGRTEPRHFSPAVLSAFRSSADRFKEIYEAAAD
jgi:putative two-component system response regulator